MATVICTMLQELKLESKLIAIIADNADNNKTLVDHLHIQLLKSYDDEPDVSGLRNLKPLMRFQGQKSYIRCLVHILNLIVKDILLQLKLGTMKSAKQVLTDMELNHTKTFSLIGPIVKIQYLALWISQSTQRQQY